MSRPRSPDELPRAVGRRIAEMRRERRWTQEQLGERLGIATKNVQRLERGQNLTLVTLGTVAGVLGVRPEQLLQREEVVTGSWRDEMARLGFEVARTGHDRVPVFVDLSAEERGEPPVGWVRRPSEFVDRFDLVMVQLLGNGGWCLLGRAEGAVSGRRLLVREGGAQAGKLISCEGVALELDAS